MWLSYAKSVYQQTSTTIVIHTPTQKVTVNSASHTFINMLTLNNDFLFLVPLHPVLTSQSEEHQAN